VTWLQGLDAGVSSSTPFPGDIFRRQFRNPALRADQHPLANRDIKRVCRHTGRQRALQNWCGFGFHAEDPVLSENSSAGQVPIFEKGRNDFDSNFHRAGSSAKSPPSLAARATAWHFLLMQKMVNTATCLPA